MYQLNRKKIRKSSSLIEYFILPSMINAPEPLSRTSTIFESNLNFAPVGIGWYTFRNCSPCNALKRCEIVNKWNQRIIQWITRIRLSSKLYFSITSCNKDPSYMEFTDMVAPKVGKAEKSSSFSYRYLRLPSSEVSTPTELSHFCEKNTFGTDSLPDNAYRMLSLALYS